jgi:uncharacterized protein DUF3455
MARESTAIMIGAGLAGLIAGCAAAPARAPAIDIPAPLQVPPNHVLAQQLHGVGAQIYSCRPGKDDDARVEWQLKEPQADLFDASGNKIGKHYAGPSWEAKDGSKVTGSLLARSDSPVPGAIAWLLLGAKATSGSGVFANVRFIQRLNTVGGNAPPQGCNQASAGTEVRVSYSADYWFYVDRP